MEIITAHAVNNLCYKADKKMTPQGIVLHSTGANNPNLKRYVDAPDEVGVNSRANHWNNPTPGGKKVCVHAFIGYDKNKKVRVAEILPLNVCAWGVGNGSKGSYNFDPAYIQIEICEDKLENEGYYKEAFGAAAEYCAYLCESFGLKVENIVGHNEAHKLGYGSNHSDPEHWTRRFGESMDTFREKVKSLREERRNEKSAPYGVVLGTFESEAEARSGLSKAKDSGFMDAFIAYVLKYTPLAEPESAPVTLSVGDRVKLKRGAKDYNGGSLASFVYDRVHILSQINGDRAVITYKGSVVAAVRVGDLIKV